LLAAAIGRGFADALAAAVPGTPAEEDIMKSTKKWLLAGSLLTFAALAGCAHQAGGGYAYGGGGYLDDECGLAQDCYAGPQYTCVLYQPASAPARLDISLARHTHSTRTLDPREGFGGTPGPDWSAGSSVPSASSLPPPPPPVAREPVVLVSPPSPRSRCPLRDSHPVPR
jgi:hypothetical protein